MSRDRTNEILILGKLICNSGKTHEKQEVYDINGVVGTILATCYTDPPKVLIIRNK